jgi:hypothetical protein
LAGFHDDARISVWRPLSLRVGYWSSLLVSVHTSEAPPGVHEREHPLRVLRRRAKAILGEQLPTYSLLSADSTLGVVEESEITLLVDLPNFDVPRGRRNFLWLNAFHMEEFHVRPSYDSDGLVTRGKVLCFHGTDLLSEITLAIRVRTDTTGDTGW